MPQEQYGCVLALLETSAIFNKIYSLIKKDDLAKDGMEEEPHVTIFYGLHEEVTTDDVREALDGLSIGQIRLSGISIFENEDADVLKMDVVDSPGLVAMHDMIKGALPNSETYPDYEPHVTIAYLKSGMGKKYVTNKSLNYPMSVKDIVYSYADRTQEIIYESIITGEQLRKLW